MKKVTKNKRGFTLIELLVVVLIIGILAAVAVPQYQKAVDRAHFKTIIAVMRSVKKAENLYKLEHGEYTLNWEELPFDIEHRSINKKNMDVEGGTYSLSDQGTYTHVVFTDKSGMMLYSAISTEWWLCYPQNNKGRRICKNLGCKEEDTANTACRFYPEKNL